MKVNMNAIVEKGETLINKWWKKEWYQWPMSELTVNNDMIDEVEWFPGHSWSKSSSVTMYNLIPSLYFKNI